MTYPNRVDEGAEADPERFARTGGVSMSERTVSTSIEVLIVITAILAALLLPVLGQAGV